MLDKTRKRQNKSINRKKKPVIENIHKPGKLPNINMPFIIRQNKQYTTYQSVDGADFLLPKSN